MTASAEPGSFPTPWQASGIALVYLAGGALVGTFITGIAQLLQVSPDPALFVVPLLAFVPAWAFGIWLGGLDGWGILDLVPVRASLWAPLLAVAVGLFVLIQALAHGLLRGVEWVLPEALVKAWAAHPGAFASHSHGALLAFALAAVIPEELLFRGMILRGFLRRYRPWAAIWGSALLFMLAHGDPLQFPVALAVGLAAGWYYQATGSLWPGIAAHAFQNFFAAWVVDFGALDRGSIVTLPWPRASFLAAAPLLAVSGILLLQRQFAGSAAAALEPSGESAHPDP